MPCSNRFLPPVFCSCIFRSVKVGDLALDRLNGVALSRWPAHGEIHRNPVFRVEKVGQHFIRQLRGEDLQEAHRPVFAAQPEHPGIAEAERGRGDKVLGRSPDGATHLRQTVPGVENAVRDFQPVPWRPVPARRPPMLFEISQKVGVSMQHVARAIFDAYKLQDVYAGSASMHYDTHRSEFASVTDKRLLMRYSTDLGSGFREIARASYQTKEGALLTFVASISMGGCPMIYSSRN